MMMPENIENYETLVKQGMFSFQFTFIEILLSQPDILRNFSNESFTSLARKAISVYEGKTVAFDKYSYYGVSSSCLILARILKLTNYPEFIRILDRYPELNILNDNGTSGNKELLEQILIEVKRIFNI